MTPPEKHVQRLLRWYPRVWRERYGEEFTALLAEDLADVPRSLRRDLDVMRAGLCARLAACGLARGPVRSHSSATAVVAVAAVGFVASALSIWTQLADGRLTATPGTSAATVSLVGLTGWLCGLLIVAAALGAKLAVDVVRTVRAGGAGPVPRPLLSLVICAGVLAAGVGLMGSRWPGLRAAHHDGLLAHAALIGWAATDSISTFWLHPSRLLTLPVGELTWMVLCPVAIVGCASSVVRLVRVTRRSSPRPSRLSSVAGIAAVPGLVAAAAWVLSSQHAVNANYRAGTLDLVLIAGMGLGAWVVPRAWAATAPA